MHWNSIILGLTSFITGIICGYFLRAVVIKDLQDKDARIFVLIVVSLMWFLSMANEMINTSYHTNPLVHGLMGSIIGFFYTIHRKK